MFFPVIISILLIGSGIIAGLVKTGRIKRGYGIQSKTRRGEIVKSKAEKKVADTLDYAGVKYLYESPLSLKVGKRWKTVRPDFYLPEYDLYIRRDYLVILMGGSGFIVGKSFIVGFQTLRTNKISVLDVRREKFGLIPR